jgi:nitroimidazol reductase NimA-like FMN-containing flavoprotein (pyridoxamine 5'-phosphate oxidase superfamily)
VNRAVRTVRPCSRCSGRASCATSGSSSTGHRWSTVYGFDEEFLYFHGSVASRSLTTGAPVCVTVTHVDGLVLARSVFEHGVNYRSAMIYGVPRVLEGAAKLAALRVLTEHAAPGQWDYARRPSRKELAATSLLALSLEEASVKVAEGPPGDGDGPDAALGLWAGVVPFSVVRHAPEPDPALPAGVEPPAHIAALGYFAGRRSGTEPGRFSTT